MAEPLDHKPRRALLLTTLLAGFLLLTPPLLARFGPASIRQVLHALQMGALFEFAAGDPGGLRFVATHRRIDELAPDQQHGIEFEFANTSDQPIAFTRTWASCGCVRVTVPPAPVPPDGKAKVVVHLDTKGMRGETTWQLAKVYTDAAPQTPYLLMIEAGVR